MVEHGLTPPAAHGGEANKPFLANMRHHKAHFIHVADDGDFRSARAFTGDKTAQTVKRNLIGIVFQRPDQDLTDFMLIAAHGAGIAELPE